MSDSPILENIDPKSNSAVPTAAQISGGIPIPAVRLLQVMSSDEWEGFTEEWLSFHKANGTYQALFRPRRSGAGHCCLHGQGDSRSPGTATSASTYDHALRPGDVYGEIGKIIYHSFLRTPPFNQSCRVPQRPRLHRAFRCRHHTWSALEGPSSPQGGGARQVGEPLRPRNWSRD